MLFVYHDDWLSFGFKWNIVEWKIRCWLWTQIISCIYWQPGDCIYLGFLWIKPQAETNSGNGFVSDKICHVLQFDMPLIIISVLFVLQNYCWTSGIRISFCKAFSLISQPLFTFLEHTLYYLRRTINRLTPTTLKFVLNSEMYCLSE